MIWKSVRYLSIPRFWYCFENTRQQNTRWQPKVSRAIEFDLDGDECRVDVENQLVLWESVTRNDHQTRANGPYFGVDSKKCFQIVSIDFCRSAERFSHFLLKKKIFQRKIQLSWSCNATKFLLRQEPTDHFEVPSIQFFLASIPARHFESTSSISGSLMKQFMSCYVSFLSMIFSLLGRAFCCSWTEQIESKIEMSRSIPRTNLVFVQGVLEEFLEKSIRLVEKSSWKDLYEHRDFCQENVCHSDEHRPCLPNYLKIERRFELVFVFVDERCSTNIELTRLNDFLLLISIEMTRVAFGIWFNSSWSFEIRYRLKEKSHQRTHFDNRVQYRAKLFDSQIYLIATIEIQFIQNPRARR